MNNFIIALKTKYSKCHVKPISNNRYVLQTVEGINIDFGITSEEIVVFEIYVFDEVKNKGLCTEFINFLLHCDNTIYISDVISKNLYLILSLKSRPTTKHSYLNNDLMKWTHIKHEESIFNYSDLEECCLEDDEFEQLLDDDGIYGSFLL